MPLRHAHASSLPSDPPDRSPRPGGVYCFSVHAAAEPGVMPRVLGLFAKRNLVPLRWHSNVTGSSGANLSIDVQVAALSAETGEYIARCLRGIWGVEAVFTSVKGR